MLEAQQTESMKSPIDRYIINTHSGSELALYDVAKEGDNKRLTTMTEISVCRIACQLVAETLQAHPQPPSVAQLAVRFLPFEVNRTVKHTCATLSGPNASSLKRLTHGTVLSSMDNKVKFQFNYIRLNGIQ